MTHNLLIPATNILPPLHRLKHKTMGFGAIIVRALQICCNYIECPNRRMGFSFFGCGGYLLSQSLPTRLFFTYIQFYLAAVVKSITSIYSLFSAVDGRICFVAATGNPVIRSSCSNAGCRHLVSMVAGFRHRLTL